MVDQLMDDASVLMDLLKVVGEVKKPIQLSVGDKHYSIDLPNKKINQGKVTGPIEVALEFKEVDFNKLITGELNPVQAFMQGKIKAKGNMAVLMKLQPLQGKIEKIRDSRIPKSKL